MNKQLEKIKRCKKCGLCCNQKPLLEECTDCEVLWVGLSAKKTTYDGEPPLSVQTNSGAVIHDIEELMGDVKTYKTNLVKCLPLNEKQKLRYPNREEIDLCIGNLQSEIQELSPQVVFLLGEKVYSSVAKHYNLQFDKFDEFDYQYVKYRETYFVPVHHPSYIYVYKRKRLDEYQRRIYEIAMSLLKK